MQAGGTGALLTVLQSEEVWYCMRGLRPTSPSTITQARGMAPGRQRRVGFAGRQRRATGEGPLAAAAPLPRRALRSPLSFPEILL